MLQYMMLKNSCKISYSYEIMTLYYGYFSCYAEKREERKRAAAHGIVYYVLHTTYYTYSYSYYYDVYTYILERERICYLRCMTT